MNMFCMKICFIFKCCVMVYLFILLQVVPLGFCIDALTVNSSEISLVDEYGLMWICHLSYELGEPGECVLMRGWESFCGVKGLRAGQR